jgi:phenylacetate-coenzyme A ligase PaaK-like adenylate-forming protein
MDLRIYRQLMSTLGQWRKHERWSRPQLEAHQGESLRRLREWAYARSPFYQRFHKGLADRPLQELPALTEAMLMEGFDDLVTDRALRLTDVRAHLDTDQVGPFLDRYRVTTSPAPGHPGIFLFDRDEWATVLASAGRVREWAGWETNMSHMLHRMPVAALASGSPSDMSPQIAQTLNGLFPMDLVMPMQAFDIGRPLEETVRDLNGWQPSMLSGDAQMLRALAEEQLAGRLRIHPHWITPDSGVLTQEARQRIKDAWGQEAFNTYWAAACGCLASERGDHSGLYVFEDHVILESVDERHRPVPAGTYGEKLLITVLSSRTQPLIRFELDESVRLSPDPSPSGLPFRRIDGIASEHEDSQT